MQKVILILPSTNLNMYLSLFPLILLFVISEQFHRTLYSLLISPNSKPFFLENHISFP